MNISISNIAIAYIYIYICVYIYIYTHIVVVLTIDIEISHGEHSTDGTWFFPTLDEGTFATNHLVGLGA